MRENLIHIGARLSAAAVGVMVAALALLPALVSGGFILYAFHMSPPPASGASSAAGPNYPLGYVHADSGPGNVVAGICNGSGCLLNGEGDASLPILAGDIVGPAGNNVAKQARGVSGVYTVKAPTVVWQTKDAGPATTSTIEECSSADGGTCTNAFRIVSGTAGDVDFIVTLLQADGGLNGGSAKYSCGVLDHAGSCKVYRACNPTELLAYTDAGSGADAGCTVSLAGDGGCTADVTCFCASSMKQCKWSAFTQYAAGGNN
jgi:hypothetical protein